MFQLNIQLHGGVKKAVKKIFGGGDSTPSVQYVAPEPVAPVATNVNSTDVSTESVDSTKKNRRKKGFSSTLLTDTLVGGTDDGSRSTLG